MDRIDRIKTGLTFGFCPHPVHPVYRCSMKDTVSAKAGLTQRTRAPEEGGEKGTWMDRIDRIKTGLALWLLSSSCSSCLSMFDERH
jgi:hypothetical protein